MVREEGGRESAVAAAWRREVKTPPYPPYLERVAGAGVSHSRIAMRRVGEEEHGMVRADRWCRCNDMPEWRTEGGTEKLRVLEIFYRPIRSRDQG